MSILEIGLWTTGLAGACWLLGHVIRKHYIKKQVERRNFYETPTFTPTFAPIPKRETARRQIISPSWGSGKSREKTPEPRSSRCISDSDSWSLTNSALSGTDYGSGLGDPGPGYHGDGDSFGGAGASGGWGDSGSSSDSGGGGSDGGGGGSGGDGGGGGSD